MMVASKLISNEESNRLSKEKKPEATTSGLEENLKEPNSDRQILFDSDKIETVNNSILSDSPNLYNTFGTSMSQRFIKFIIPSEISDWLQETHPNAFLLLCLIAKRARRHSGHPDGLEIGEAFIGDFKKAGIESERKYRTAKDVLIRIGAIKICETCRNRKKSTTGATTGTTTVGTKVKLLKSDIWDINQKSSNDRNDDRSDDRATTERRPSDDEQEVKDRRKNKNYKKENIKEKILLLKFGELVELKEEDYKKFVEQYGIEFVTKRIQEINDNYSQNGKVSKNYSATMRTFIRNHFNWNEEAKREATQGSAKPATASAPRRSNEIVV